MPTLKHARRTIKSALITLLLLPALLQAEQEERWYQVEVIIFSQNNPDYRESEQWPLDYTLPNLADSRELLKIAPGNPPQPFTQVAQKRLQLGDTAQRIKNAGDVKLVLHLGWLQPGLAEDKAVAVHISEGELDSPSHLPRLDGTLRLVLSRYLHLQSDLIWREAQPSGPSAVANAIPKPSGNGVESDAASGNSADGIALNTYSDGSAVTADSVAETMPMGPSYQVFRLQQSRRMRSSETHYLDHPLFGIIARVTPYEPVQP